MGDRYSCPICGNDYKQLGSHWGQSDCGYPDIPEEDIELLTGVLMGDGTLENPSNARPRITIEMTNKPFLEWLDQELGWLTTGVRQKHTAEEKVERAKEDDYVEVMNEDNWSATYILRTRSHPQLKQFISWYQDKGKVFPEDIELTPQSLKMWYVCDGSLTLSHTSDNPNLFIYCSNEVDVLDKIKSYFEPLGVKARDGGEAVYFSVKDTEFLLNWMGDYPSGFRYKWFSDTNGENIRKSV